MTDDPFAESRRILAELQTPFWRDYFAGYDPADEDAETPSITCPVCKRTSWNPNDIREGFCGNCHAWTSLRDGVLEATTLPPPELHPRRRCDDPS